MKQNHLEAVGGVLRALYPRRKGVDLQVILDQLEDVPVRVPSREKRGGTRVAGDRAKLSGW